MKENIDFNNWEYEEDEIKFKIGDYVEINSNLLIYVRSHYWDDTMLDFINNKFFIKQIIYYEFIKEYSVKYNGFNIPFKCLNLSVLPT